MAHVPNLIKGFGPKQPIKLTSEALNRSSENTENRLSAENTVSESVPVSVSAPANEGDDLPLFWQNEIDDIRQEAVAARAELDDLRDTVNELSDVIETRNNFGAQNLNVTQTSDDELDNPRPTRRNASSDREALISAGVSPDVASAIQQQRDQRTLARLELLDQAAREGWTGTERLDNELDALNDALPSLRDELGDEAYDRYLYSAGRSNRVSIASVIAGSAADIAGLQVGDIIMRYASQRMFNMQEVRDATREGVRNEPILLEVVRDQQPIAFEVTRGPLGVTMTASRVEP